MAAIILDKDEEPKREDTPTYAIGVKGSYLIVRVESYEYDELKEWMPFIKWNGYWVESYPLVTTFTCPACYLNDVVRILRSHNYIQKSWGFSVL